MTTAGLVAKRGTYGGVFIVTLASLMYEILLTRIFSVTTWYHFAFVAISIALSFPLGFFMGMAFPFGMMIAGKESNVLTR